MDKIRRHLPALIVSYVGLTLLYMAIPELTLIRRVLGDALGVMLLVIGYNLLVVMFGRTSR